MISISDVVRAVRLTAKRRVSLEEQELLTLPEHMNSSPIFTGVRVSQSLAFCVEFCICTFFFVIALSPLLSTASDYPFGIFKRFLKWADNLDENCINLSLWIQNCTHPDKIPSRVYQQ